MCLCCNVCVWSGKSYLSFLLVCLECCGMNGVTDGTAYWYLLVAEYRMGSEMDGLSSYFVFRLNIPQLFFSLLEPGFFLLLLSALCSRVQWSAGWKLERADQPKLLPWDVFSGSIFLLVSPAPLSLVHVWLIFRLWSSTMYRLFFQNHTVSGCCPFVWVLLITPSLVLCLTLLTAEFPPLPLPAHFSNFEGDFQY